jgi:hypothetical protein
MRAKAMRCLAQNNGSIETLAVIHQSAVPRAVTAKFTLSGITKKPLLMVIPIFVRKNHAVEARCCM